MKSLVALVRREFLEHRGAFVYAPAVLVAVLIGAIGLAFFSSRVDVVREGFAPAPALLYEGLYLIVVGLWSSYLLIGLFFYFADAFSADRKNNAMLFWKSMPQSDLKILGSKILAGATIFPLLILGWLIVTSLVAYLAAVALAVRIPELEAPALGAVVGGWFQISLAAIPFIALSLLWYAPVFAWVGGLSAVFRGWSIPLSIVIPVAAILFEMVLNYSGGEPKSAILDFISWRLTGFYGEHQVVPMLMAGGPVTAARMVSEMLAGIDWTAMATGLVFTALATWAASEYRRRRIEA